MSANRIVVAAAILFLTVFLVVMAIGISHSAPGSGSTGGTNITPLALVGIVLVALVVLGSRLYGSNSHYGRAAARTRLAQDAHERAIDEARAQSPHHDAGDDPNGPETEPPE